MPSNPDLNADPDTVAALEESIRTLGKAPCASVRPPTLEVRT
jgi:hypothetical protein